MEGKYKRLIKDTFIFSLGSLGSKIIMFIMVPLYTYNLSKAEYGTSELVFTVAQLMIPVASVTIWNGLIRFGLMKGQDPESVFKNSMLIWAFGAVVILAATPLVGLYSPISEWKWYMAGYSIAYIASFTELSYLKVKGYNKTFALASILQTFVLASSNVIFIVFLKTGVRGYLISNIVANIFSAAFIFIIGRLYKDVHTGRLNRDLLKKLILYSAPLILNDISWWLIHSSDKIMIEWMISAEELGLYTVASKIPGLINTFVDIFSQAWGVSSIKEIEDTNDTAYYSRVFNIYGALAFGAAICFNAIIKPFMSLYVGPDFFYAWQYVPVLLLAASFSAISTFFGAMFGALKMSVKCMCTTVIGALSNVVLNYILIGNYGAFGAIIATAVSFCIIAFMRLVWVNRYIRMSIDCYRLIIDIVVATVQGILITINYNIVIVSVIAVLILIINHFELIKRSFEAMGKLTKR